MYRSRQPVHVRASMSPAPAINMFSNAQTRVADCGTL